MLLFGVWSGRAVLPLPFDVYLKGEEMVNNLIFIGIPIIGDLVSLEICRDGGIN